MTDARKFAADGKDAAYKEAQKIEDSTKNPFEKAAKRLAADSLKKKLTRHMIKPLKKLRTGWINSLQLLKNRQMQKWPPLRNCNGSILV